MKKILKPILLSLALVLTLAACGGGNTTAQQELRLVSASPLNTLSHIVNTEAVNAQVIENFLEGLLTYDEDQNLVGSMAETWEQSTDGLTYTFHLRPGIEWSNGTPVTAKDFVFSWQTLATHPRASFRQMLADANIKNAQAVLNGKMAVDALGIVAPDDQTVVVTLASPSSLFEKIIAMSTFSPINEAFYQQVGADSFGTSVDTILANGPFKLTTWQPDTEYVLEKNDKYWNASNVKLEKISTRIVKESATRATLYDNGEIDRLDINTDLYERYKDDPNIIRQEESAWSYIYLSGNNGNKSRVLGNHNFRAAIAHALDKQLITDQILKNGSVPANYLIPQNFDYLNGKDFRTYANQFNASIFDVEKAKNYLAAAKSELAGEDLSFEFVISDSAATKLLYENVKFQIEKTLPEVKITLKTIPANIYFSTLRKYNTNASAAGWNPDYADVYTFFSLFKTNASSNMARWTNAEYDRLVDQATQETDPQKRWDYFVQAERILIEDYSIIPLYQRGATAVMNPKVKGFKITPIASLILFKYVYIE